ncbi:hypothetical protein JZ751_002311 [Albula glossodonta]|uniref:Uncharacterized protein n=1 Tax=Albula glossodonta TaxID=121402 RepID=A0A8T2P7R0_9TELE|nr:hypothetical protein JZ751_002311 [Albula glossodonta]
MEAQLTGTLAITNLINRVCPQTPHPDTLTTFQPLFPHQHWHWVRHKTDKLSTRTCPAQGGAAVPRDRTAGRQPGLAVVQNDEVGNWCNSPPMYPWDKALEPRHPLGNNSSPGLQADGSTFSGVPNTLVSKILRYRTEGYIRRSRVDQHDASQNPESVSDYACANCSRVWVNTLSAVGLPGKRKQRFISLREGQIETERKRVRGRGRGIDQGAGSATDKGGTAALNKAAAKVRGPPLLTSQAHVPNSGALRQPGWQNTDSSRTEASWEYPDQKANQVADKTELIKEVNNIWKSSLENSALYGQGVLQGQSPLGGDLRRKLSLESQRLRTRLEQELRELRERLSSAFSFVYPTLTPPLQLTPASAHDQLVPLSRQLRDTLDNNTHKLCVSLSHYAHGPETTNSQGPSPSSAPKQSIQYQEAVQGIDQMLGSSDHEMTAHLEEFQTQAVGMAEGLGGRAAVLRQEVEAFSAGVRSRAESLRAGLDSIQAFRGGLSKHVVQFCHTSSEENRLFSRRIEQQLAALGQGRREDPGEIHSVPPESTGSLVEDFSPKLTALLQDILKTLN